eukprot:gene7385-2171_t
MACLAAACIFFWISTFGAGDRSCGFLKWGSGTNTWYGGFNSIPIVWWKATIVMHGIGCAVVLLATVGSLMTVFRCTQKYQRTVHNSAITGAIFIFIGLILFCVGFKDMKSGGQGSSPVCEICGSMTGPFVLQDCKIGDDLIFMIVGVVGIVIGAIMGSCIDYDKQGQYQG